MNNNVIKSFTIALLWFSTMVAVTGTQLFSFKHTSLDDYAIGFITAISTRLALYFALITIAEQILRRQENGNSLYYKTGWLIYVGACILTIPLTDVGSDMVRKGIGGMLDHFLVVFSVFLATFIIPLFVHIVVGFFFWTNKARIALMKGDIQAPAAGLIILSYIALAVSLIAEIFVEAFRTEAIIFAAFCTLMIMLGFTQFAKVDCATLDYYELTNRIKSKPIGVSHSLLFAGGVSLMTSASLYFSGSLSDVPAIVLIGAVLHFAATIIIGGLGANLTIKRELKRIDTARAQTFKNKVGAP